MGTIWDRANFHLAGCCRRPDNFDMRERMVWRELRSKHHGYRPTNCHSTVEQFCRTGLPQFEWMSRQTPAHQSRNEDSNSDCVAPDRPGSPVLGVSDMSASWVAPCSSVRS